MKFSEFKQKMQNDAEYLKAAEDLQLNFLLAKAVVKARLNKDWTQTDLARAVGTRQANISRIEAGLANPTLDLIKRLAKVLDLDIKFQLSGMDITNGKGLSIMQPALSGAMEVENVDSSESYYQPSSADLMNIAEKKD